MELAQEETLQMMMPAFSRGMFQSKLYGLCKIGRLIPVSISTDMNSLCPKFSS